MISSSITRRNALKTIGSMSVVAALAGCTGGGGGGSGGGGSSFEYPDADYVAEEPDYGDWFDDVENYNGTLDLTGRETITIGVGADGGLTFAPPAVLIDAGTEIVWEWTGEGGLHDVVEEDDAFASEQVNDAGFQFTETLAEPGTYLYVCTPHVGVGMKGAVVVD